MPEYELRIKQNYNLTKLNIFVPVRYQEEDIPNNFPCRSSDKLYLDIDLEKNKIINYKWHEPVKLYLEVDDSGSYTVFGKDLDEDYPVESVILELHNDYVPACLSKNGYGKNLVLDIDENGFLNNFEFNPDDWTDKEK